MSITRYPVTGLTCGHCAHAVTEEVSALPGVTEVTIDLEAGGTSTLSVTSNQPVDPALLAKAIDEAGDYQLVTA